MPLEGICTSCLATGNENLEGQSPPGSIPGVLVQWSAHVLVTSHRTSQGQLALDGRSCHSQSLVSPTDCVK